jgi:hypothetical protein
MKRLREDAGNGGSELTTPASAPKTCFICCTEAGVLFQLGPCGHADMCRGCVVKMAGTNTGRPKCPLCVQEFKAFGPNTCSKEAVATAGLFAATFKAVSAPEALASWVDQALAVRVLAASLAAGVVALLDEHRVFRWLGAVLKHHPGIQEAVLCVTRMTTNVAVLGTIAGHEMDVLQKLCTAVGPAVRDTKVVRAFGSVVHAWPRGGKVGVGADADAFSGAVADLLDAVTRTSHDWGGFFTPCLYICEHFWLEDCDAAHSRKIVPKLIQMWAHPRCVLTKMFCLEVCCKLAFFSKDAHLYETCVNRLLLPTLQTKADDLNVAQTCFDCFLCLSKWQDGEDFLLPHVGTLLDIFRRHRTSPGVITAFFNYVQNLACGDQEASLLCVVPEVVTVLHTFVDNAKAVQACFRLLQNMCWPTALHTEMMCVVPAAVAALRNHKGVLKVADPATNMFFNLSYAMGEKCGLVEAMPVILETFRCHLTDNVVVEACLHMFENLIQCGRPYGPFLESVVPDVEQLLKDDTQPPTLRECAGHFLCQLKLSF